jgi:predicted nucleic acid-binding protein
MRDSAFVDSNIWLYAMAQSDDAAGDIRYAKAKAFLLGLPRPKVNSQVIRDVCCNLLKKSRIKEAAIQTYVLAWYRNCDVVSSNAEQFLLASGLRQSGDFSYWDSLIVAAALDAGCTTLFSEDMQHGRVLRGQLTIVNPFQAA